MATIEALFALDPAADPRDVLEAFVPRALFDAGVWPSPRRSDGVTSCRIVDHSPTRVRLSGRIWDIDQALHSFWLDVSRDATSTARTTWTLYFDVDPTLLSPRRARNALDAIRDPRDVAWITTLTGTESIGDSRRCGQRLRAAPCPPRPQ